MMLATIDRHCRLVSLALLVGATLVAGGCTKEKDSEEPERKLIIADPEADPRVEIGIKDDPSGVTIRPVDLPPTVRSVSCRVGNAAPVDCANGLKAGKLKDGAYDVEITVVTERGNTLVRSERFEVKGGKVIRPNKTSGGSRFELSLAAESRAFEKAPAVDQSHSMAFHVALNSDYRCATKYQCSRNQDHWSLCSRANSSEIVLEPREIGEGLQKLWVRASCDDVGAVSNVLAVQWYGVPADYQPLALSRRWIRGLAHYRLAKENDCTGKLRFECQDVNASGFARCPNIKADPAAGFKIRARCESSAGTKVGPVFLETPAATTH